MLKRRSIARHGAERGQVLIFVLLVLSLVVISFIAGVGDFAIAANAHEKADEAATLGAQSGAQSVSVQSLYQNAPALDPNLAVTNCDAAVQATAPQANRSPDPCQIVGNSVSVTVIIPVQLPLPVPFFSPIVRAHRVSIPLAGTNTGP